jgi:beta-glucosidase
VNPELNASDAFVAAWLPGSEGGGVADVLFRSPDGGVAHDFTGRLSFSWPARPRDAEVNSGDPGYAPLFPLGYGLSYGQERPVAALPEDAGEATGASDISSVLLRGRAAPPWSLVLQDAQGPARVEGAAGQSPAGAVRVQGFDRFAQEDALRAQWRSPGAIAFALREPLDLRAAADEGLELVFEVRTGLQGASLILRCGPACGGALDATAAFQAAQDWRAIRVPLACFKQAGGALERFQAIALQTDANAQLEFSRIGLEQAAGAPAPCPAAAP